MKIISFTILCFVFIVQLVTLNQIFYIEDLMNPQNSRFYIETQHMQVLLVNSDTLEYQNKYSSSDEYFIGFKNLSTNTVKYYGNLNVFDLDNKTNLISEVQYNNVNTYTKYDYIYDSIYENILGINRIEKIENPDNSSYSIITIAASSTNKLQYIVEDIKNYLQEKNTKYTEIEYYANGVSEEFISTQLKTDNIIYVSSIITILSLILFLSCDIYFNRKNNAILQILGMNDRKIFFNNLKNVSILVLSSFISACIIFYCVVKANGILYNSEYSLQFYYPVTILIVLISLFIIILIQNLIMIMSLKTNIRRRIN